MSAPDPTRPCPACGSAGPEPFYDAGSVPMSSCALVADRAAALDYPTGRLVLAHCGTCGFITNPCFDTNAVPYDADYEDTQSCSGTFDTWARGLARTWIGRHGLDGKAVVEVGCGRGDFLALLIEEGVGRATGIDPAVRPGRHTAPAADRLGWIAERYDRSHGSVPADAVACRHTLEHVADVGAFVDLIVETHASEADTPVLIEVPDTTRVLREGAFWDVYHEHCSYFTADSLARLLGRAGLDLDGVALEYDGQYLVADAVRGGGVDVFPGPAGGGSGGLVSGFTSRVEVERDRWQSRLDVVRRAGGRTAIWGAGSKAVAFLGPLADPTGVVAAAVDINPRKWGHYLPGTGIEVVAPADLSDLPPTLVVVMNPVYRQEIGEMLDDMGVAAELVALGDRW